MSTLISQSTARTWAILAGAAALVVIVAANLQRAFADGSPPPTTAPAFVDLIRDDFFSGDTTRFQHAMQICEQTLAKNPADAQAMVWHGAGLVGTAQRYFQESSRGFSGHMQMAAEIKNRAIVLQNRGLKEMDAALALDPESVEVLIPRGSTYLSIARADADAGEAKGFATTGANDFEKVLQIQTRQSTFAHLTTHARGELLFGLADGRVLLGNTDDAKHYLQRIVTDCAKSDYATRATDWLGTTGGSELVKKAKAYSCIGCHTN
jgi:hypothetical protein